jgi:hypothetical protein
MGKIYYVYLPEAVRRNGDHLHLEWKHLAPCMHAVSLQHLIALPAVVLNSRQPTVPYGLAARLTTAPFLSTTAFKATPLPNLVEANVM